MQNHFLSFFCALGAVCFLSACTPIVSKHGYNSEILDLQKIEIGKDTTDTVLEKLSSPSSKTLFPVDPKKGGQKWFYISKRTATKAFFAPETIDQQTIVITFNDKQLVTDIKKLEGEYEVPINTDKTNSTGYETSMIRDIFGNFGRYSNKKQTPSGGAS